MKRIIPICFSGILLVALGLYMILRPDSFIQVFFIIIGAYMVFDSLKSLFYLFYRMHEGSRLSKSIDIAKDIKDAFSSAIRGVAATVIIKALINLIFGLLAISIAIARKDMLLSWVVYIVAISFLFTGAIDLFEYIKLSGSDIGFGLLGLDTVVSFILGLILFLFPRFIGSVVITLIAAFFIAVGAVAVYGGINMMLVQKKLSKYRPIDAEFTENE